MKTSNLLIILFACMTMFSCSDEEQQAAFEHPFQSFENRIGSWNWIDVEGMICRDGSNTGIGVRLGNNTTKWMIYLQGGGACFTPGTCEDNPATFERTDFEERVSNGFYDSGILNNERNENPLKDWNVIFIPYCTGDVHSGDKENGFPLGGTEEQQFVGIRNLRALLDYSKPYMENQQMDEFMIAGISAGGFGSHLAYFEFKEMFPDIKTHVINDSGPLVSDSEVLPGCLSFGLQFLYDLPLPSGYLLCCQPSYGLADIYTLASRKSSEDNFGMLSTKADNTIRFFFSAGQNSCAGGEISEVLFEQGLIHLRENVLKPSGQWSTFFTEGDSHTFIQQNTKYFETNIDGKLVYEWVSDVMNGTVQHLEE